MSQDTFHRIATYKKLNIKIILYYTKKYHLEYNKEVNIITKETSQYSLLRPSKETGIARTKNEHFIIRPFIRRLRRKPIKSL